MALIRDEDRKYLSEEFEKYLKDKVDLVIFKSDSEDCKYCEQTVEIGKELASINSKINLIVYDFSDEKAREEYGGVTKYPAVVVAKSGEKDGRIKYYGLPSGYEFGSLVEDIKNVSRGGEAPVSSKALEVISKIDKPIKIKVYVTPTCPYCPRAVGTAHKFAILNKNITGEMIESLEFESEAEEVGVSSVPHVVINDEVQFVGALPDDQFAQYVKEAYENA